MCARQMILCRLKQPDVIERETLSVVEKLGRDKANMRCL